MKTPVHTLCSTCAGGTSVICMSGMGAASAGAGASSMAGMSSMGSMVAIHPNVSASFAISRFFESIGLGFLNELPNDVAQPLLIAVLAISLGATYLGYRGHRELRQLALAIVSAIAIYVSIYAWMSEPTYYASLAGWMTAALWGLLLSRRRKAAPVSQTARV